MRRIDIAESAKLRKGRWEKQGADAVKHGGEGTFSVGSMEWIREVAAKGIKTEHRAMDFGQVFGLLSLN
jgi:hypothetical protein